MVAQLLLTIRFFTRIIVQLQHLARLLELLVLSTHL